MSQKQETRDFGIELVLLILKRLVRPAGEHHIQQYAYLTAKATNCADQFGFFDHDGQPHSSLVADAISLALFRGLISAVNDNSAPMPHLSPSLKMTCQGLNYLNENLGKIPRALQEAAHDHSILDLPALSKLATKDWKKERKAS